MIKVRLSGSKILSNYSREQVMRIKEDLTFPNPLYESALKHSSFGAGSIPPHVHYYREGKGGLLVPRGYVIPFPYEIVEDTRTLVEAHYPPLHIQLRDTQKEAVDSFIDSLKHREEHGVIILPTGKGKSILGLYLAHKVAQRVLVIVQKDDLVDGWTQDAKVVFNMNPLEVGKIKGKVFRIGEHVTVTTIQTLTKLPPDKIKILHESFGMIICDEFHHSVATIYKLIEYFPARFKIGLTATPIRNDGLQDVLYLVFGKKVYEYADRSDDEDILPVNVLIRNAPTVFEPEREVTYNKKKGRMETTSISISTIRKATSFDDSFNIMLSSDILKEYNKGKSCIVFTHEKDHCRLIQRYLENRGIPSSQIQLYYGDSRTPKDVMKNRAERKEVLITIATYSIATEGTNVKAWERAFLASTIANELSTVQAIGRIRRTMEGKTDCLVYDYRFPRVIVAKNHGKIRDKVYKERGYHVEGKESTNAGKRKTGRGWGKF